MSVSSGSDVTIPIQDSPPPPPSPYANRSKVRMNSGKNKTPEPRGDFGVDNIGFQPNENGHKSLNEPSPSGRKKSQTEIAMEGSSLNEAVNPELLHMNVLDTIPQKPQPECGPYENFESYFIPVNKHKRFLGGEKLYVTKDKRKASKWKKYVCWLIGAFVLASIVTVAVLAGVGVLPPKPQLSTLSMVETTTTGKPDLTIPPSSTDFISTSERQQSPSSEESTTSPISVVSSTPPSNYVPGAAEIQLTLENAEFNDSLSDPNSPEFKSLASEVQSEFKKILEAEAKLGNVSVRVIQFSPGSVVVKLRLGWDSQSQVFGDVQKFVSGIRKVGEYDIRVGTTTYNMFNFCNSNNNGCSHHCIFDYESLDFPCTCPEYLLLAEDKKTCEEITSPSPSSPSIDNTTTEGDASSSIVPEINIPIDSSPEPEIVPETSDETNVPPITDDVSSSASTPILPADEQLETNSTASAESEVQPDTIVDTPDESHNVTAVEESPDIVLPNLNISEISNTSSEVEEPTLTTIMPDMDYNVELNPELTQDSSMHSPNMSEKFSRIVESEPSIFPTGNSSEEVLILPGEEADHPDHLSTTSTQTPLIIFEIQNDTASDPPRLSSQEEEHVIRPIQIDLATTSTTTTTTVPPFLIEVNESEENGTTSSEGDNQSEAEEDVEVIHQNVTDPILNNTLSRLKASRSENFEMGHSGSQEFSGSESEEPASDIQQSQEELLPIQATIPPIANVEPVETGQNFAEEKQPEIIVIDADMPNTSETPILVPTVENRTEIEPPVLASEEREKEALATDDETATEPNHEFESPNKTETVQEVKDRENMETMLGAWTESSIPETIPEGNQTKLSEQDSLASSGVFLPPRPHISSDEFMAFSDANMSLVNAKLKKNVTDPSSASVEAGSEEALSTDDSQLTPGSHSEEAPVFTPVREIEEVTTFAPISLLNDTAVNNLTENVTEDLLNTENIFQMSEESVLPPVTENPESREKEHGEEPEVISKNATTTTTVEPIKPQEPDHLVEDSKPKDQEEEKSKVEAEVLPSSQETLETTTTRNLESFPGFSTTLPILTKAEESEKVDLSTASTTTTKTTTTDKTIQSNNPHASADNENELN